MGFLEISDELAETLNVPVLDPGWVSLKYAEALASYEQTIKICTKIGDDGMELQLKAEQQLPGTYFNVAKGLFDADSLAHRVPAESFHGRMGAVQDMLFCAEDLAMMYCPDIRGMAQGNS